MRVIIIGLILMVCIWFTIWLDRNPDINDLRNRLKTFRDQGLNKQEIVISNRSGWDFLIIAAPYLGAAIVDALPFNTSIKRKLESRLNTIEAYQIFLIKGGDVFEEDGLLPLYLDKGVLVVSSKNSLLAEWENGEVKISVTK